MSPKHVCTVQMTSEGRPYLAFAPADGRVSSFSNSLFTLDLREGASVTDAEELADQINRLLWGVSTTVF